MMRCGWPGGRTTAAAVVAVSVVAGCSGGSSGDTLTPIDGSAGTVASVTTPSGSGPTQGTALDPASVGSGFVQVQVSVGATGVDETLSLDRATVRKDSLDPASLNATCTPLDGGDTSQGVDVTVVDLRRLAASSNRLISAELHVKGAPEAGEHEATLQLGAGDQTTTAYQGTVELAEGGWGGTLEMNDAAGNSLTGSFACAAEPLPTTTAVPDPGGDNEAVPGTPAPTAPDGT
jgi:hypothetical protein